MRPFAISTAVRQTPLIETESPIATPGAVSGASTSSRSAGAVAVERSDAADLANDPREHPPRLVAVRERFDRLANDHLEPAASRPADALASDVSSSSTAARWPGASSSVPISSIRLRSSSLPSVPHQPLREQVDDLVVGALELRIRGHGPSRFVDIGLEEHVPADRRGRRVGQGVRRS